MTLSELFLWPGTAVCRKMGVDPEGDAGLIRWMFNTIFYLFVTLALLWFVLA